MSASQFFFTSNEQLGKAGEKIKLEFSIINPTNASYSMQAKLYDNKVIDYNSETKTAQNNILIFENFLLCDFFFEKEQKLFIILKKNN